MTTATPSRVGADWTAIKTAYFEDALATYTEGDTDEMSERAVALLREANRAELRLLIEQAAEYGAPADRVEILADDCRRCWRDNGGMFDLQGELRAPRIPRADCEDGWCACEYLAVFE